MAADTYDYDLVVIGSGPAGQRAAIQGAKLDKKVAIIERKAVVGGYCVNLGTIPSKTLREAVLDLSGYRGHGFYGASYTVKEHITMQDLLVRMLGNVTSTQTMMLRLAQLQDEGLMQDEHASLAKAFCTVKCRETVGYARELLGGNGILLDNHIGRFVADAEAIYSYEGTREMNTLIVGNAITGLSAFV